MNLRDSEEIRVKIKTLDDEHLECLRIWLEPKYGQDSQDKLLLVKLEQQRRRKLRGYYENHIY